MELIGYFPNYEGMKILREPIPHWDAIFLTEEMAQKNLLQMGTCHRIRLVQLFLHLSHAIGAQNTKCTKPNSL